MKIGKFSRGGKSRKQKAESGLDHDYAPDAKLAPFGVLEVGLGQSTIVFGESRETSDFIVDALERWYAIRKKEVSKYKELFLNIDNGPTVSGSSRQFLKRMVMFSKKIGKPIHLVYYPPYHSKYNLIERFWGVLERYWNGMLLDSVKKTFGIAKMVSWRNIHPVITSLKGIYKTGISPTKEEVKEYNQHIRRSESLPKWDVYIYPKIINR